ncbi:hypothetical protein COTS27_01045 [Spirochaetota bacterium]|nr:hypothetical protein COTS27_01045 [Spirochaetota bacterium]
MEHLSQVPPLAITETVIGIVLAVLSYLIKRLISRIDKIETEVQSLKLMFTELNIGAVKRNGFDKRIETLRAEIETLKEKVDDHEKTMIKKLSLIKRAIVKVKTLCGQK